MSYAVRNDGKGWRAVRGPEDVGPDETFSLDQPAPFIADPKDAMRTEITELEASITPRRMREALVTGDTSFIERVDAEIFELRKQLQGDQ